MLQFNNPRYFGRSQSFREFLDRQSPETKRQIVAAEQRYLRGLKDPVGRRVADAVAFAEIFKAASVDPALAP